MHAKNIFAGVLGSALILLGPGCATVARRGPEAAHAAYPALSPERAAFAEALAAYAQGVSEETRRDFDAALAHYQRAAELDPANEELHFRIAMALLQKNRTAEAISTIERLCERYPKSERAWLAMAVVYRATDNGEKAARAYERAIRCAPESFAAYIELAALYEKMGRGDEAIALLSSALGKVKEPEGVLRMLGALCVSKAALPDPDGKRAAIAKDVTKTLEEMTARGTEDASLLYILGDLYIAAQDYEKAIACFEKIEAKNPDDLRIKQKLAQSFLAVGDRQKAIKSLEGMADRQPTNSRIYFYLGALHEQLKDKEKALLNYALATKGRDPQPAAYIKMAALLSGERKHSEAEAALIEGLQRFPEDARLHEMLAYVYLGLKDHEKALRQFARATELLAKNGGSPLSPNFHLHHAIATQLAGNISGAASILSKAMSIDRAYLEAYVQYSFQEDIASVLQSVSVLDKLGESTPNDPDLFVYIGVLNNYAKIYPAAIAAFEKAEKLASESADPEHELTPAFYFWFGSACERIGQIDRAEDLFLKSLELDPDNAQTHNYLAYMWAEKGLKLDQALQHVRKALDKEPDSAEFIDTLGWIYYMQGKYEEAARELRRAHDLMPDDPTVKEHMGDVLDKLGRPKEALEYWKQSFVLDATNDRIAQRLTAAQVDLEPLKKAAEAASQRKKEEAAKDQAGQTSVPDPTALPEEPGAAPEAPGGEP
jgi:tetratricopeptide (TPR) repeat protein